MNIRKSYADTSQGQIHVHSSEGDGMPAILFHQTASSGKMWIKTMEQLSGSRPMYAFDTPGFGGSFDLDPDARPSMAEYAEILYEAVQAMGISRCHVVGHHTGACIVVDMVAQHPELAQSLTLLGPAVLTAEERQELSQHFGTPFTPTETGEYLMENWEYLKALGAHQDPLLINREMSDQLRAWWGRVQSYNAVWGQDFMGLLQQIECPLMLGAAPDDVLYPFVEVGAKLKPNAKVLEISGANYEPDLDTDRVAAGLKNFFAEHD